MGIRVTKFLGYGLTDVAHDDNDRLVDSRINRDSCLLNWEPPSIDEFEAWLKDNSCADASLDRWYLRDRRRGEQPARRRERHLDDCLAYNPEFGLGNVLVLQPLAMHDWTRYDDPIDWVEESYLSDPPQANRAQVLRYGLYPYMAQYMDSRTGERLPNDQTMTWVRSLTSDFYDLYDQDEMARGLGFDDHAQALELIAPNVPAEIRDIARFCELFTIDDVWKQLRPMLYVYWA
jgi:hypothetical protein